MARLEFEVHRKEGVRGTFFMGNLRFPAQIETDDLVGFFYPDDKDQDRGFIVLEPRRTTRDTTDGSSPRK
jgi:hypothetical protein